MPLSRTIYPPSITDYLELIKSPHVDIYVGQEKKNLSVPMALLCYYSNYFDHCFNANFKEAQKQTLELPDDKTEYFEALISFMLKGTAMGVLAILKHSLDDPTFVTRCCREFLEYEDKYDLARIVADIIYQPLYNSWNLDENEEWATYGLGGEDIEVFFEFTPCKHPLRDLVIHAALYCQTDYRGTLSLENRQFEKQEKNVEGFATGILEFFFHRCGGTLIVDQKKLVRNLPLGGF